MGVCTVKHMVILGIFLVNFPNGLTWYYGNLSSYAASSLRFYLGPAVDVETVWLMSVFLGLWTSGLVVGALLQKVLKNARLLCFIGVVMFDGAFAVTAWTIKHSLPLYISTLGAVAGLADGIICSACMTLIAMWESERPGLATALATSSLGFGALVINQIISRYVNPHNLPADKEDGNLTLFSQEEVVSHVPKLFLVLAIFNFVFHMAGLALIRHNRQTPVSGQSSEGQGCVTSTNSKGLSKKDGLPPISSAGYERLENGSGSDEDAHNGCPRRSSEANAIESGRTYKRPRVWTMDNGYGCSIASEDNNGSKRDIRICRGSPWGSVESLMVELPGISECIRGRSGSAPEKSRLNVTMPSSLIGTYMHRLHTSGGYSDSHDDLSADNSNNNNNEKDITGIGPLGIPAIIVDPSHLVDNTTAECNYLNECSGSKDVHGDSNSFNSDSCSNSDNEDSRSTIKSSLVSNHFNIVEQTEPLLKKIGMPQEKDRDSAVIADEEGQRLLERSSNGDGNILEPYSMTPGQMVCTKMFFILWTAEFCMDYTLSVLTNYYKLFGQLYIHDDHFLAMIGTVMTASMIIPKLAWGSLLDRWGAKTTIIMMTTATVVLVSFWAFTAQIDRYLYSAVTLALCWCVCAFDSLAAAAVLVAFGPDHYTVNYGLVASASILLNLVSPLVMQLIIDTLGWPWLFLSVAALNTIVLVQTMGCISM